MESIGTSSMTNTFDRAFRRLSHPILRLIFVKSVYALENVPCSPGAGNFSKFASVYLSWRLGWGGTSLPRMSG